MEANPCRASCAGTKQNAQLPAHALPSTEYCFHRSCKKSSTVLMNRLGWSTKVMWPDCGTITSFDPAIFSCMVRESDGSDSSWSPQITSVGTWIVESLSRYSTDFKLPSIMNSPSDPHISRYRSQAVDVLPDAGS